MGWIGGVAPNSNPPVEAGSCLGAAGGRASGSGWCKGGVSEWKPPTGTTISYDGYLKNPKGIAYYDNFIYVVDDNHRVSKFGRDGKFEGWIGAYGVGVTTPNNWISTAPTSKGGTANIENASGKFVNGWSTGGYPVDSYGDNVGGGFHFGHWHGCQITVGTDSTGNTYLYIINDYRSNRIDRYDPATGEFRGTMRVDNQIAEGWPYPNNLSNPSTGPGVALGWNYQGDWDNAGGPVGVTTDGTNLYVSTNYNWVRKYNLTSGSFIGWNGAIWGTPSGDAPGTTGCQGSTSITPGWCVGGSPNWGKRLGMYWDPTGLAVDENYLYIVDHSNNRIQRQVK
jgi:hypothetical protein